MTAAYIYNDIEQKTYYDDLEKKSYEKQKDPYTLFQQTLEQVLRTPQGKYVFSYILGNYCGVNDFITNKSEQQHGRMNLGRSILDDIYQIDPKLYAEMLLSIRGINK